MIEAIRPVICCEGMRNHLSDLEDDKNKGLNLEEGDYGWVVPGCCGGGCWIMSKVKFCPWCGKTLEEHTI